MNSLDARRALLSNRLKKPVPIRSYLSKTNHIIKQNRDSLATTSAPRELVAAEAFFVLYVRLCVFLKHHLPARTPGRSWWPSSKQSNNKITLATATAP